MAISVGVVKSSELLQKCITHFETFGFVKLIERGDLVEKFSFGPLGQLLLENVRREWIHSNVRYRDHSVFLYDQLGNSPDVLEGLKEPFKYAKTLRSGEVPFGLASSVVAEQDVAKARSDVLSPTKTTLLRHFTFLAPNEAEQYYYRWQQQRKRWWRLFSADPSRFSFAEAEEQKAPEFSETKILASFPWGSHCLEIVRYHESKLFQNLDNLTQNIFSVRGNGKRSLPHVIECVVDLDMGAFTYMCDAFKEKKALKSECVFHRKLAPYKFGFAADPVSAAHVDELMDLSKLLSLGLERSGISTLLPGTDLGKKSLLTQLSKHSTLGIPYTLVFHEETLKNGIAGLYSMRTTLQEDVHVGNFEEYALKIMKNY